MEDCKEKLAANFAKLVGKKPKEIDFDANIFDDYGVDSVQAVKLLADVEVEYDIDIPEEKAQKIRTLNDLARVVGELQEE